MKIIFAWLVVMLCFMLEGQLWQKEDFSFYDSLCLTPKPVLKDTFKVTMGESFLFGQSKFRYQMASGFSYSKHKKNFSMVFDPYVVAEIPGTKPYYVHSSRPLGGGMPLGKSKERVYIRPLFDLSLTFWRYFLFKLNYGHEHYGDGYRSFLPSRQSPLYPSVHLGVRLNKFTYDFGLAYWQQKLWDTLRHKFTVIQYARWAPLKWLHLGFYESATWSPSKLRSMGVVELTYLQPFAFLRPIDYSMGSPANMFMAGLFELRWKTYSFYTQVVLDEFYIAEYKNEIKHILHPEDSIIQTGAWVNKQALQVGLKSFSLFGVKGLGLLLEANIARPYIYSHSFPELSFSHQNQPVAHPLGGNFYEVLGWLGHTWKKNALITGASYVLIGLDGSNTHFGQNILQATSDGWLGYNIPVTFYGNHIAQGNRAEVLTYTAYWLRKISWKKYSLYFYSGISGRYSVYLYGKNRLFFVIGLLHHMSVPDFLNW